MMQLDKHKTATYRACAFKRIGLDSFAFNFDSLVLVCEQTAGYVGQIIHHLHSKHRVSINSEVVGLPAGCPGVSRTAGSQKRDQHQADSAHHMNSSGSAELAIPARFVVVQAWHVLYLTICKCGSFNN